MHEITNTTTFTRNTLQIKKSLPEFAVLKEAALNVFDSFAQTIKIFFYICHQQTVLKNIFLMKFNSRTKPTFSCSVAYERPKQYMKRYLISRVC